MRKRTIIIFAACIMVLFCIQGNAATQNKGPKEIIVKSTIDPAKKPKPAFFPHAVHQEHFECARCHHSVGQTNLVKCETCHNKGEVSAGMPKKLETFKKAAHVMCKGCHTERKKAGEKAGPTKCNGCHPKDLK